MTAGGWRGRLHPRRQREVVQIKLGAVGNREAVVDAVEGGGLRHLAPASGRGAGVAAAWDVPTAHVGKAGDAGARLVEVEGNPRRGGEHRRHVVAGVGDAQIVEQTAIAGAGQAHLIVAGAQPGWRGGLQRDLFAVVEVQRHLLIGKGEHGVRPLPGWIGSGGTGCASAIGDAEVTLEIIRQAGDPLVGGAVETEEDARRGGVGPQREARRTLRQRQAPDRDALADGVAGFVDPAERDGAVDAPG
jgi:hypothetical protein